MTYAEFLHTLGYIQNIFGVSGALNASFALTFRSEKNEKLFKNFTQEFFFFFIQNFDFKICVLITLLVRCDSY